MKQPLVKYYEERAATAAAEDFLSPVGHTLGGKPISNEQFEIMVAELCGLLDLQPNDRVLDLCCGNGVITQHFARIAETVIGVDFSDPLIGVAKAHHQPNNVSYYVGDALNLLKTKGVEAPKFSKIVMNGALQHFSTRDFEVLIGNILAISTENPLIVLSLVPEQSKKYIFYNTPKRWFWWMRGRIRGFDPFGSWWTQNLIENACKKFGRRCQFHSHDHRLESARYRFSVVVS